MFTCWTQSLPNIQALTSFCSPMPLSPKGQVVTVWLVIEDPGVVTQTTWQAITCFFRNNECSLFIEQSLPRSFPTFGQKNKGWWESGAQTQMLRELLFGILTYLFWGWCRPCLLLTYRSRRDKVNKAALSSQKGYSRWFAKPFFPDNIVCWGNKCLHRLL